jgi:hypothetical protein
VFAVAVNQVLLPEDAAAGVVNATELVLVVVRVTVVDVLDPEDALMTRAVELGMTVPLPELAALA